MSKTEIGYAKTRTSTGKNDRNGKPIKDTIYCFYPGGVWDEDKLTKAEAEARYPRSTYRWRLLKD